MRKVGEIVRKKPGAGFCGESLVIKLVDIDSKFPPTDICMVCDNPKCREWINCEVVEGSGTYVYHVSECEMEDL